MSSSRPKTASNKWSHKTIGSGRDTDETERLMIYPYFVTFILRPNAALDYQTFHSEPQRLLSRRDDTCERLRPLRGLRPYEESAERPSVYVERMRR